MSALHTRQRQVAEVHTSAPIIFGCILIIAAIGFAPHLITPSPASSSIISIASMTTSESGRDIQTIYENHCAMCHGVDGQGDGDAALLVFPRPRDFTSGVFRFKSTPQQQPPTHDDLVRVISNGIARTAMPGFSGVLTGGDIDDLAAHVLTFNQGVQRDVVPEPIEIPVRPEFDDALVEAGRRVYVTMACGQCHGDTGRGDGSSSYGLRDADGFPLPPADFTSGVYKAGDTPEDLYRTILIGVPGTPMPSFESAMQAGIEVEGVDPEIDMVWAMVAYMDSIVESHDEPGIASGAKLRLASVEDATMMRDPLHGSWRDIDATTLSLQPLWQRRQAARSIDVKAVANAGQIAIHVSWPDSTVDAREGVYSATDGVAIMWSLQDSVPVLGMGRRSNPDDRQLVNLWHWKASRQLDADKRRLHDVDHLSPGEPSDHYWYENAWRDTDAPIQRHDPVFLPAWAVGNPHADPQLLHRPVIESNAAGFGSLTEQNPSEQTVDGIGRWLNGRWHVVFVRQRSATSESDVNLGVSGSSPVALAVWDGASLDRDGTKLITSWHWLTEPVTR